MPLESAPAVTPSPVPSQAPIVTPAAAAPPPAAPPAAPPVATPYPVAQAAPAVVQVPIEQFQILTQAVTRLQQIEENRQAETREAARKEAEAKVQVGQLTEGLSSLRTQSEAAIAEERRKAAETEDRARQYAVDSQLSTALADQNLVPGVLNNLKTLLRPGLQVVPEGNSYAVRTPTFQDVTSYVKDFLSKPEGQIYVRPPHQGGVGTNPGASAQPPATAEPVLPRRADPSTMTMGEAAIIATQMQMKETASQTRPIAANLDKTRGIGGFRGNAANHPDFRRQA